MDEIADLISTVLRATKPRAGSRAKYDLPARTAAAGQARAAELLDLHPLYPGIGLA